MSTTVEMPVRVNPPPAGDGGNHLAGLGVFGNGDTREGGPDGVVVDIPLGYRDAGGCGDRSWARETAELGSRESREANALSRAC